MQGATLPLTLRTPGICETCHGNGAKPGTQPRTCPVCHGAGVIVTRNQGSFSFTEPCRKCQGVGTGRRREVPGVPGHRRGHQDPHDQRAYPGRGSPTVSGSGWPGAASRASAAARPATCSCWSRCARTTVFGRTGDDLTLTVPITFAEAVLGTDLRVPTLDGAVTLRVPPGTPSGRTLRVRGKGVARRDGKAGDLLVTLDVDVPAKLSDEAREALDVRRPRRRRPAGAARRVPGASAAMTDEGRM